MQDMAFSGAQGLLDRCAPLRIAPDAQAALWAQAQVLPLWRGKLACNPAHNSLVLVPQGHAVLAQAGARVFLGKAGDVPLFAADISAFSPQHAVAAGPAFLDTSLQPHPDLPDGCGFADLRAVMTGLSPLQGEIAATARAVMQWHSSHAHCARCGAPTDLVDSGWRRHCRACDAAHFPRTDPVVIMLVTRGDHLLLGRGAGWPEGMYSLLAGFIEPGEVFEAAVRREVFEETGVRLGQVRYLASQPWPFPANLMLGAWAHAISTDITLDPNELQDAVWLSRQEVLNVQLGRHPQIKPGRRGAIAQHLIQQWLSDRID
jgi:NAD+ diphosphatase